MKPLPALDWNDEERRAWMALEGEVGVPLPLLSALGPQRLGGVLEDGKLRELGLQGLALEGVPRSVGAFTSLRVLDLGRNRLRGLPASLAGLPELKALLLRKNALESLPAWLSTLRIEHLNLGQNPLSWHFLEGFSWPETLSALHLNDLGLSRLPPALGGLKSLERLSLYGNQLKSLPAWITALTTLRALTLGDNGLEFLPEEMGHLKQLVEFSIYRNALTSVPESLTGLVCLEELGLHGNRLAALPVLGWEQMTRLRFLALFGNCLTSVPEAVWHLPGLRSLLLHDNPVHWSPSSLAAALHLRSRGVRVSGLPELAEPGEGQNG